MALYNCLSVANVYLALKYGNEYLIKLTNLVRLNDKGYCLV